MHNKTRLSITILTLLSVAASPLLSPLAFAEAPPNASPMAQAQPLTATPTAGLVLQQLSAGSYTYMHVRFTSPPSSLPSEAWIAVVGTGFPPDTSIEVTPFASRTDFFSPRLDRTFSTLIFASATAL